ncbi:hypothetical protein CKO28_20545 [Rhodovibrio sodomensis]|uniref:DUF1653 domain-containing protein n=1 Tax=Rhodovibrio sodomensis TaxID=1088 RepID=A0ABS1DKG6_9PROT|nr:DUF1653 domain-containing protein [Rhodovibrio sodomensis]MBK1670417.1 hypothetical protein [Rhodovibrio sodomensis]
MILTDLALVDIVLPSILLFVCILVFALLSRAVIQQLWTRAAAPDAATSAQSSSQPAPAWQPTHQHRKGGLYRVLHRGLFEATCTPCVVYQAQDGSVWARSAEEFDDGRFTPLSNPALQKDRTQMQTIQLVRENAVGLAGDFNTCRLGTKWYDKLSKGEICRMALSEDDTELCRVEVTDLVAGKFTELAPEHAPMNHAYGDETELRKALGAAYGEQFDENAIVTFIYLRRLT